MDSQFRFAPDDEYNKVVNTAITNAQRNGRKLFRSYPGNIADTYNYEVVSGKFVKLTYSHNGSTRVIYIPLDSTHTRTNVTGNHGDKGRAYFFNNMCDVHGEYDYEIITDDFYKLTEGTERPDVTVYLPVYDGSYWGLKQYAGGRKKKSMRRRKRTCRRTRRRKRTRYSTK
jgi:hypothetical protein